MTTEEYCKELKYPIEEHQILTEDGYILSFFRIQAKNTQIKQGLPVVYFQHGLEDSSDLVVMANQEDLAPGLILANAGYDVWLGNSRGNFYSTKHTKLKPKEREFWQFTFQHMAIYDLPAALEYITKKTGKPKVNYIGHSQGTMQMHAALSLRIKTVIDKVSTIISLGPVAFVKNINSPFLQTIAKDENLYPTLDKLGIWDLGKKMWISTEPQTQLCLAIPQICKFVFTQALDLMPSIDNFDRIQFMTRHFPMGTSSMNVNHFQQLVLTGKFQMYDYGAQENMKHYNQTTPPQFDLSKIQEAVHLFAGDTDVLADPIDVVNLYHGMSNSQGKTLNMYHLGHATFLFGKDKKIMSFMDDVMKLLDKN